MVEGPEKLHHLTSLVGEEIARMRGQRAQFAPRALAPDRISHKLRHEVPMWAFASVFALLMLLAYLGMSWNLSRQTRADLSVHNNVVSFQRPAQVIITLP